jgi:uncharacterized protein (TIGR03000 family)
MYSIVLMVAMSGGTEVPDFGRRRGRGGCYGGYSYGGWGGGNGGCSGGYWGGGYGGCSGGGYGGWGGGGVSYGCSGGGYLTASGGNGGYAGMSYSESGRTPERIRNRPRPVTQVAQAGKATIILNVPADAWLTIDGKPTTSRSTSRVFVTPPLQPNRVYHYDVRAQVDRGGRTMTLTRRIAVRAGQVTRDSMTFAPTQVARTP